MKEVAAAVLAGLAVGAVSRFIDIAAWAPDWLGYVFTPWLAAAWLAGSLRPSNGALLGLAVLCSTVAGYIASIVVSGTPVHVPGVPGLVVLATVAGPIFGAAGSTWRGGGRGAAWGGALLGVVVILEGLALQLAVRSTPERLVLVGESLAGIGLAVLLARRARGEPCGVGRLRGLRLPGGILWLVQSRRPQEGDPGNP